jgi:hypothetical protein
MVWCGGTPCHRQTLKVESTFGKETAMAYPHNPNDPRNPEYRREFEHEADEEGTSTAAWAGIVFMVLLLGGIAVFTFTTPNSDLASGTQPGIEQPVTTGQGGAQSKMPPAREQVK